MEIVFVSKKFEIMELLYYPEPNKKTIKKKVELKEFNKNIEIDTIVSHLNNGNYSPGFIKDIEIGLKKSSIYTS